MTSERDTPPSQKILRDKSRLHAEKAYRNGTALVPASAGPVAVNHRNGGSLAAPANHHRRQADRRSPESELTTSFDPMKDMHMWTMWRAAVNGRIVDEARKRHRGLPQEPDFNPYGRALVKTPLNRFIRIGDSSQNIAHVMMDPHQLGNEHLHTSQFVFYGVPRVVLNKPRNVAKQVKKLP